MNAVMQLLQDNWYALQVRSNHEVVAERWLRECGYEILAPRIRVSARSPRVPARARSIRPFFPGYIFCRFDGAVRHRMVDSPAVVRIVGFGGVPIPVDDVELESLHILASSDREPEGCEFLREGERVQVCSGPLRGAAGIMLRRQNQRYIVLQVTILQRSVSVMIEDAAVMSVEPASAAATAAFAKTA